MGEYEEHNLMNDEEEHLIKKQNPCGGIVPNAITSKPRLVKRYGK